MIVQFYFTVLILVLRSVAYGDFLDANNAQTCMELCAHCNGTAIFEAGRCECYFTDDKQKRADHTKLVKKQTEDLELDLTISDLTNANRPARCALSPLRQFRADDVERVAKYFMGGGALASPFFPEHHLLGSSSNPMTSGNDPMTGQPNQMAGSCNPVTGASDMFPSLGKLKSILRNPHDSMTGAPNLPRNNLLKAMSAGSSYNPSMTGTKSMFPAADTSEAIPVSSSLLAQPQRSSFNPMSGAAYPLMNSPMGEIPRMQQFINPYPMAVPNGMVGGQQPLQGPSGIPYAMNTNNVSAVQRNMIDAIPQHMIGNAPMVESMGSPCVGSAPSFGNDNAMSPSHPNQYQHMIGNAPMVESMGSPCVGSAPSFGNDNAMSPSHPNQYQHMSGNAPMVESVGSPCVGSAPSFGNDNAMSPSRPNQYQHMIGNAPMVESVGSSCGVGSSPSFENDNAMGPPHPSQYQHMIGNAPMVESMGSPCVGSSPSFENDNAMSPSHPNQYQHIIGNAPMVESIGSPYVGSSPSFGYDNAMGPSYPIPYQGFVQSYPMHYFNENPYLGASDPQIGGFASQPGQQNPYPQLGISNSNDAPQHSLGSSYCSSQTSPLGAPNPNHPSNVGANNAMSSQNDSKSDSSEARESEKLVKSEKKPKRKPSKNPKLGAKKKYRDLKAEASNLSSTETLNKNEVKEDINQSDKPSDKLDN